MKLCCLLQNVGVKGVFFNNKSVKINELNINVLSLTQNSKTATKNSLFFALSGGSLNGESFVIEAINNGATVVVAQNKIKVTKNVVLVVVKNVRIAMAKISALFYENAHKKLKIIGITGTNGKSSCTYIIHSVLQKLSKKNKNLKCGLIGTNAVFIGNKKLEATLTTPDPILLHELFYKMVQAKVKICVMEISSHSIYWNKIYGLNFECIALTNVKCDHLDFFKTKQLYKQQKENLFYNYKSKNVVLNLNDKTGKKILNNLIKNNTKQNILTFSSKQNILFKNKLNNRQNIQTLTYKNLNKKGFETSFKINFKNSQNLVKTNLLGEINVQNLCLCFLALQSLNLCDTKVLECFKNLYIEGRLNIFNFNKKINFILDYAHTFSSTKAVLKIIKNINNAKNFIVIGSPGNRDEFKRKKTSKICKKFGTVILTSDNPKYENPYKIMEEMKKGNKKAILIENRENAIKYAFELAKKTNKKANIIVLGKGIENYQDYNNNHFPYSDLTVIKNLIK